MIEITQVDPEQKVSWAAEFAMPDVGVMFSVLPSVRWTWYRLPVYALYSDRVVLCAATQGVPPEA
jgi:hypothetical protein